jgi:hypothetical protein
MVGDEEGIGPIVRRSGLKKAFIHPQ